MMAMMEEAGISHLHHLHHHLVVMTMRAMMAIIEEAGRSNSQIGRAHV